MLPTIYKCRDSEHICEGGLKRQKQFSLLSAMNQILLESHMRKAYFHPLLGSSQIRKRQFWNNDREVKALGREKEVIGFKIAHNLKVKNMFS